MVKEIIIPKENLAKIEEVREIENKFPSYEEFMNNYEYDASLNYDDLMSYSDISELKGYGPGSSQSSYSDNSDEQRRERHLGKAGIGVASSITSKVTTPIVPSAVGAVTTAVGEIGHALSSESDTKDAWKYASELGQDMVTGSLVEQFVDTSIAPVFENSGSSLAREGWDLWKEFMDKGGKDKLMIDYHDFHLANKENYSSYCDVCKS